ncbi:MAG: T9SS type A sorting domain-containing protein [Bacteroidetes bacterium]|nr:T9SS type A sorting domain-containing protein [Bacteroidota bacterium]MBK7110786.1 T9SS type A sorting domain-containing protein [Bacteroidota bacterium]MBK8487994.1 T9SS type A sorting domain-containing protein [Bacteroidota bacterium]MBK8682248.1 T9SS type A sorting domain-containing protein [Bacteroidota bacterium]
MKKLYVVFVVLLTSALLNAQSFADRVLILNEGYFDYVTNEIQTPVSLGSYEPAAGLYTTLFTIDNARFASDLIVDADNYFIAADNMLLKYDRYTDALLQEIEIPGIRKIAASEDYIVVTRGEYMHTFDSYVVVLNRENLETIFEVPAATINYSTEGVEIIDGKAYIAVNNGFVWGEEVGFIAVINLNTQSLESTIDLGADGKNPDNLMWDGTSLYTLNNKDFTGSSISSIKISSGEISTNNLLNVTSGCGTSVYYNGAIYYQDSYHTSLSRYNILTEEIADETEYGNTFYGLAFDEATNEMYTSVTDFYSYGEIYIYDLEGNLLNSFEAGVSPGNIAFDKRSTNAIISQNQFTVNMYPVPAQDYVMIESANNLQSIELFDIAGKLLQVTNANNTTQVMLDIKSLPAGLYTVRITSADGITTQQLSVI